MLYAIKGCLFTILFSMLYAIKGCLFTILFSMLYAVKGCFFTVLVSGGRVPCLLSLPPGFLLLAILPLFPHSSPNSSDTTRAHDKQTRILMKSNKLISLNLTEGVYSAYSHLPSPWERRMQFLVEAKKVMRKGIFQHDFRVLMERRACFFFFSPRLF